MLIGGPRAVLRIETHAPFRNLKGAMGACAHMHANQNTHKHTIGGVAPATRGLDNVPFICYLLLKSLLAGWQPTRARPPAVLHGAVGCFVASPRPRATRRVTQLAMPSLPPAPLRTPPPSDLQIEAPHGAARPSRHTAAQSGPPRSPPRFCGAPQRRVARRSGEVQRAASQMSHTLLGAHIVCAFLFAGLFGPLRRGCQAP